MVAVVALAVEHALILAKTRVRVLVKDLAVSVAQA